VGGSGDNGNDGNGGGGGGYGRDAVGACAGAGGGGSGQLISGGSTTTTSTNTGNGLLEISYAVPVAKATALSVSPAGGTSAGTPSTLTAAVTSVPAGSPVSGSVTFFDGSTQLGSGAVSNGVATLTLTLAQGTHNLTAQFTGTGNDNLALSMLGLALLAAGGTMIVIGRLNPRRR
jgi:Bacterial Ig-like domain (group 3)